MPSKVDTCKKDHVLLLNNTILPTSVSMVSSARCASNENVETMQIKRRKKALCKTNNFSANLQNSYEMDLTPSISTRKNTDSFGAMILL